MSRPESAQSTVAGNARLAPPGAGTLAPVGESASKTRPPGFWRRRVLDPIVWLLTHGVTVEKVTRTVAVAFVCSLFPFLGTTSLLNLGVGLWLRMNQPIMQSINYLLTPVHLLMILVYVRIGERIWGAGEDRFTVMDMLQTFRDKSIGEFLQQFGMAGVHAFTAWAITAPLFFALIYFPLRPIVRRFARRATPGAVPVP